MPDRGLAAPIGALNVVIKQHPVAYTNERWALISWQTSGIVGETRCRLDSVTYTYCPGIPARYTGLSDGRHTFTVRIRNGYQRVDTATVSWTVDTVEPLAPAVSGGGPLGGEPPPRTGSPPRGRRAR